MPSQYTSASLNDVCTEIAICMPHPDLKVAPSLFMCTTFQLP